LVRAFIFPPGESLLHSRLAFGFVGWPCGAPSLD